MVGWGRSHRSGVLEATVDRLYFYLSSLLASNRTVCSISTAECVWRCTRYVLFVLEEDSGS
jgi:hypothetical protein